MTDQEDIDAVQEKFLTALQAAFDEYCMTKYPSDGESDQSIVLPVDWVFLCAVLDQNGERRPLSFTPPKTPPYVVVGLCQNWMNKQLAWMAAHYVRDPDS